ncbi:glycosyltransferase [Tardisphaera saccharovorans]
MKVLLVNISPSRSGVGNYVKLIMKYSHFSYDLLNVSLFGRSEPSLYPLSPHGKTEHMSVSSGPLQGLLKFYSGAMGRQIAGRVRAMGGDADAVFLSQQDLIHSARAIREQTGKPVVATDRPPMNEILPVGHFVSDPFDPAALAEALSRTIEDGDEVVKGYASLRERFSINRFVSEFEGSMRSAAEATAR